MVVVLVVVVMRLWWWWYNKNTALYFSNDILYTCLSVYFTTFLHADCTGYDEYDLFNFKGNKIILPFLNTATRSAKGKWRS